MAAILGDVKLAQKSPAPAEQIVGAQASGMQTYKVTRPEQIDEIRRDAATGLVNGGYTFHQPEPQFLSHSSRQGVWHSSGDVSNETKTLAGLGEKGLYISTLFAAAQKARLC